MAQVISRNKNKRQQFSKTDMLINEMQNRKKACLIKMQKLSDRINILEGFKNETSGREINLKNYLKSKGHDYRQFFSPMGYFTPNNLVVSADSENKMLTYDKGMSFNKNVGFPIPKREIVQNKDHNELTSSMYGMTWNPALMHYYPTTVFDSKSYSSAEGIGDTGMDIIGGLRTEDFANLSNENDNSLQLTAMVQELLEEEYDNVESELDIIEEAEMQLLNGVSNFQDSNQNNQLNMNSNCQDGCGSKFPFNKVKREICIEECEETTNTDKFSNFSSKSDLRKQQNKVDRENRGIARDEKREGKKDCKAKLQSGELQKWQYNECLKKERKEKRLAVKEAGGTLAGRGLRGLARINPFLATSRGGVLVLVGDNAFGFATRLAPALLPDAQANELFKPDSIVNAKKGWERVKKAYKNLGGDNEKLRLKAIEGYKKKPYKIARKESFEGDTFYEIEEQSNFIEPITQAALITGGSGVLISLINAFTKGGGDKNPYKDDKTPEDYKKAIADGTVESNPPIDADTPIVNEKGEWIEPSTGKVIDPLTGKYKDTIFGINKWLAIGIGVAGLLGIYYVLKSKK